MYKAGGLAPPTAAVPFYCSPVTLKRPLADERRTTGAMLEHLYGLFWGGFFPRFEICHKPTKYVHVCPFLEKINKNIQKCLHEK